MIFIFRYYKRKYMSSGIISKALSSFTVLSNELVSSSSFFHSVTLHLKSSQRASWSSYLHLLPSAFDLHNMFCPGFEKINFGFTLMFMFRLSFTIDCHMRISNFFLVCFFREIFRLFALKIFNILYMWITKIVFTLSDRI